MMRIPGIKGKIAGFMILLLLIMQTAPAYALVEAGINDSSGDEAVHSAQTDDELTHTSGNGSWIIKWKGPVDPQFMAESEVLEEYASHITVARPATDVDPFGWLEKWKSSKDVEYIQKNHTVEVLARPNDTAYGEQNFLQQIGAEAAWDMHKENRKLVIALIDTGVDLQHADLKDNLVEGINLIDPDQSPQDDNGHGTNVAGVIAAVGNNKQGVTGVLWRAQIMPVKALLANGRGDEDKLGEGIRYAVDHGVKIIVLSVGLYPYSQYMREIVQYAEDQGVLLISASGNDGQNVKYPAAYPTVLAVGGVTASNRVVADSNFGPEIDVVAPWDVYTTRLGGGYMYNEGTSMAAPQVAGVAALLWAKYPDMKPHQIRHMICQTAQDIEAKGWDPYTGYGLLRADRALSEPFKSDFHEKNDSRESAKTLPLETLVTASFGGPEDRDWFRVQAPYDGTLRIELKTESELPGIQLKHYRTEAADSAEVYLNAGSETIILPVKKGNSWIELLRTDKQAESVNYRLVAEFTIQADAFEDNDRQYKAFVLPSRTQKIKGTFHQVNDEDWFVMNFEQTGSLSIKATSDTIRMDLALLVQRRGEKALEIDLGGDGEPEYSPTIDVQQGKYYIRVKNAAAANAHPVKGEYTLHIDYAFKYVDPNEPNDKQFQSTPMTANTEYRGVIDKTADTDWFSFKLTKQNISNIRLSQIPSGRIMSMVLFDQNQKQLAANVNTIDKTSMRIENVLAPGTYYVRLTVDRPFQHQMYSLSVSHIELIAGYKDISGHWAQQAIVELTKKNIVKGYGTYSFSPDRYMTRAEAAVMIARAFQLKTREDIAFTDVSRMHWAYEYIGYITAAGITHGYPDGKYMPDKPISRAEMAVMLGKALKLKERKGTTPPFTDVAGGYWAAAMLRQMKAEGFIAGYTDGSFRPDRPATRAQFAYVLWIAQNSR